MLASWFGIMVFLLFITVPVAVTLFMIAIYPNLVNPSFAANPQFVIRQVLGGMESTPLLAIPMFVLSGIIMAKGEVSKKLFEVFSYFIGDKVAGMPCTVVLTCLFYGAISGSGPATTAAVGTMTIPILIEMGYDPTFCTALVAVAGGLGVIIPPSIPFIVYGLSSGASVGELFLAGIIPGILIGVFLMVYTYFYCRFKGEDREKIYIQVQKLRERSFSRVFVESFWAILSPIIILGGIYTGIVTPTEAAVISVVYSILICLFVYKTITFRGLLTVIADAVKTYAPILFILGTAAAFSRVLTLLRGPQQIASILGGLIEHRTLLLLAINVFLLFVGMIIDTAPSILILSPILLPIVKATGMDPIQFGVMLVANLAIGFVTPPVGLNLYVASTITNIPITKIARKAIPLMIAFFFALLFITLVPQISLFLVKI
jgi:C4-dicarboxylate transporter DctM subunit